VTTRCQTVRSLHKCVEKNRHGRFCSILTAVIKMRFVCHGEVHILCHVDVEYCRTSMGKRIEYLLVLDGLDCVHMQQNKHFAKSEVLTAASVCLSVWTCSPAHSRRPGLVKYIRLPCTNKQTSYLTNKFRGTKSFLRK
jgi:hypothetical protein